MILTDTIYQTGVELNRRAAIKIPDDARQAVERMYERETHKLSKYVLGQIVQNYAVAIAERRPMCADTGLPRFYAKVGNEACLGGEWWRWNGRCAGPPPMRPTPFPYGRTGCIR
jgi:L(+)-tartrate dehydratase alpha subunit